MSYIVHTNYGIGISVSGFILGGLIGTKRGLIRRFIINFIFPILV